MTDQELRQLYMALQTSPDNVPLRKIYISGLLKAQKYSEAEIEAKEALRLATQDVELKLALAEVFLKLEKVSPGLVILEEITDGQAPPPRAWFLYAQLVLKSGDPQKAKDCYEKALILDSSLKDAYFESELNLAQKEKPNAEPERIKLFSGNVPQEGANEAQHLHIERPKTTFEDVGGMDVIKEQIRVKIIFPLEHPDLYKAYGKKIGGGILLYGPPGCGKTHLARATAGQVRSSFLNVGIADILDMYIGQSERNLAAIFKEARALKPSVLFFDEVDALGANRSDMRQSAGRHLINQFLDELDGVGQDNEGVLVLAATNAPWHLDPAFRRPGRFDRIIFVPPPDAAARESIFKIKLKGKPVGVIDFSGLVKMTDTYSGADLEAVIDRAVETKIEESMRIGKPIPIETSDLVTAAKAQKSTTREWFQTAKNYALFANEAGLYDDILDYLNIKK